MRGRGLKSRDLTSDVSRQCRSFAVVLIFKKKKIKNNRVKLPGFGSAFTGT